MKNYLITAGIALGVVLLVLVAKPKTPTPTAQEVAQELKALGAVSNPDIQSPYFSFGGVRYWGQRGTSNASTTPCAIQSPAATSTLVYASFSVASTSATATYLEFGKDTTAYSTTTSLGIVSIGANVKGTAVASSTANWANVDGSTVFTPNTYLVAKVMNAAYAQLSGTCQAVWVQNAY